MLPVTIKLPWPSTKLSPNVRVHWAVLAKAKKAYKEECIYTAKAQGLRRINETSLHAHLVFYPPTKRAYDIDNAISRCKSLIDAIRDVVAVDDSLWSMSFAKGGTGGYVEVTLSKPHGVV